MTSSENIMDPELWSNLQYHVSLDHIFSKMTCRALYQLRSVCKEWNSIGKQQLGFSNGFRTPFFVIVYPVPFIGIPYHAGILTLHIASGQWRWKPQHICGFPKLSAQLDPLYAPFSMNGLVFFTGEQFVYDIHTKKIYKCEDIKHYMSETGIERPRVLAMAVDTSVTPFQNKIVLGSPKTNTRIFCRNKRESKPSRIPSITSKRWPLYCLKSCLQCNDRVYVWWRTTMIQVYSLKEDKWTALNPPENSGDNGSALGTWNNRLFVVGMKDGPLPAICVWELVDESKQVWREFAQMPREMYAWVVPNADDSTHVYASFYNCFVLMYTVLDRKADKAGISDNFVMFNLESKRWEKMSLWDKLDEDTDCHLEDTREPRYKDTRQPRYEEEELLVIQPM